MQTYTAGLLLLPVECTGSHNLYVFRLSNPSPPCPRTCMRDLQLQVEKFAVMLAARAQPLIDRPRNLVIMSPI